MGKGVSMPVDLTLLAAQAATILVPFLVKQATTVGEKVLDKYTDKLAAGLWEALTGEGENPEIEQAGTVQEGEADKDALATAIEAALEANPDLPGQVNQYLTVHGDFIQTGNISNSIAAVGTGAEVNYHIGDVYYQITQMAGDGRAPSGPPVVLPAPYYAHSYPGTAFTGRASELAALDEWAAEKGKPLMAWIAIGGMGKSALAWHWTRQHAGEFDGVLWWSFYDEPFQSFVEAALPYLSAGEVTRGTFKGGERIDRLVDLLHGGHFLLVMDGFERELDAYRGLNAAYLGDAPAEQRAALGDSRLDCIDPQAHEFLRTVGVRARGGSKILLTSRLFPNALADRFCRKLDGVRHEDLDSLHPADAVDLFEKLGVVGTRAEIEAACAPLGYHPFSLRLLAGYITEKEQRQKGDIRAEQGREARGPGACDRAVPPHAKRRGQRCGVRPIL